MKKGRHLATLAVVTVVAVAAVIYTRPTTDDPRETSARSELVSELPSRLEQVVQVDLAAAGESVRIRRDDGQWVVTERSGYPADEDSVRGLLFGLAGLVRVEAKTQRPEQYRWLGLDEGSDPVRIELTDADGQSVFRLLVGNRQPGARAGSEQYFVRVGEDAQVWLVEGRLPALDAGAAWLQKEIVSIDRQRIGQVQVRHPDGEIVQVQRESPAETDFTLVDLTDAEKPKSLYSLNALASFFADLRLDDVRPLPAEWPSEEGVVVAEVTTFDGLRVVMEATVEASPALARFTAESVPEKHLEGDATGGLRSAEDVESEAAALSARFEGWVYELPDWTLDTISKRRADLVEAAAGEDSGS